MISSRRKWPLVVVAFALLSGRPEHAPAAEAPSQESRDAADKTACQANLNLIFEAIQECRKQHQGKLPGKLSDLTPEFIHDPKILICPFYRKTGDLRSWRKQMRDLDFDPTSYSYEFPLKEIGQDLWRGLPKRTFREYKERQMGLLGPVVPIVRCHAHRSKLNLAFDGHIYESNDYWEDDFAHLARPEDLTPARVLADPAARRRLTAGDFPPRDPRAPPQSLDLIEHCNALLVDSWQGFPGDNLADLPPGLREFGGVPFDVRGLIQLRGLDLPFPFPEKVEGIKVKQKFARIHFLHGAVFRLGSRTNIASYLIHYSDNQVREIPIAYGEQIADWWFDPKNPSEPTAKKVVWTGHNEAAKAYGKALRLYQMTWENPLKDVEVASIGFVSRVTVSAPFLIAITVEP